MIQSSVLRQAATRRNKWRQVFRQVFSKIAWNLLPYLAVPIGERGCVIAVVVQNFPQYLVAGTQLATRLRFRFWGSVFPYPKRPCVTQLYIVYYFLNLYFIYIRYTYAHTHAKGEPKKVAGCRLRFLLHPESVTLAFCNCNFATFGNGAFGNVHHGVHGVPQRSFRLL